MPEEELPEAKEMAWMVSNIELLSDEARDTLMSLMEHMAEAHYQATQAVENFAQLSKICTLDQLMIIMKFAARPLLQMEGTLGPKRE